jgi:hydroxymethylglutaryl-CoA lyase
MVQNSEMSRPLLHLVEVGPRDGIQSLGLTTPGQYPDTNLKRLWIERLVACGLSHVEVGAFVHPDKVPAMADTAELIAMLPGLPGVSYRVLVPNLKGLDRALQAGARHIAVFTAASDGFTQHNMGLTVEASLQGFVPVVRQALAAGLTVRGYVSTVVQCPYNGPVPALRVADVTTQLLDMGCYQVSLGETLGAAYPADIHRVLDAMAHIPVELLAIHAHDTYGRGVDNSLAAVSRGIRTVDSSTGGIGGCPFAPGAKGNVATEAIIRALPDFDTGIDLDALLQTNHWFQQQLITD